MGEHIGRAECVIHGSVAVITLRRAAKLHALNPDMLAQLEAAVRTCEQDDDVRAVVVAAEGDRAFCVGADLDAFAALEPYDVWRRWVRDGHRVFDRLAALRQPSVAAINGLAFGGGLELALATDLRVASPHARFAMPEVTVGTAPGWGGSRRLTALVGVGRAKELVLTGEEIDAPTALAWGLVNRVTDDAPAEARRFADRIATGAPLAVQLAKQLVDAVDDGRATTTALEGLAGALSATTADSEEGVRAFRQKRIATFKGR